MTAHRLHLVAFTGAAGAGKDTCGEILAAHHGYHCIAFAAALKHEIAQAWRTDRRVFDEPATKNWALTALAVGMCCDPQFVTWAHCQGYDLHAPRSPRWVMQRWGTDYRRATDPAYWLRIVARWSRIQLGLGIRHQCITDVRMHNEADLVRELGGKLIRVHNPHLQVLEGDTANHPSELHTTLPVDADLVNDGSIEQLTDRLFGLVDQLHGADALPHAALSLHTHPTADGATA